MSAERRAIGSVGWVDLTSADAPLLRDFYVEVVGWKPDPVSMGDYDDYCMNDAAGAPQAGVCHRRGVNAELPPAWIVYFVVADLDASIERCIALGGKLLSGPRGTGDRFCVVQDPVGAVCALYQQAD